VTRSPSWPAHSAAAPVTHFHGARHRAAAADGVRPGPSCGAALAANETAISSVESTKGRSADGVTATTGRCSGGNVLAAGSRHRRPSAATARSCARAARRARTGNAPAAATTVPHTPTPTRDRSARAATHRLRGCAAAAARSGPSEPARPRGNRTSVPTATGDRSVNALCAAAIGPAIT
jgi:hypothetical protein